MADDQQPSTTSKNPFDLIAYLLFKVRHSLEISEESGRPPRWIRIARAREARAETDYIAIGVRKAMQGFAEALSYLAEITLDIREVLVQADAAKALVELTADFIKAATDKPFTDGLELLVGASSGSLAPLNDVAKVMEDVKKYVGYVPDPEDVINLNYELFRLLHIRQVDLPRKPESCIVDDQLVASKDTNHIDVAKSGKIRLIQWAFDQSIKAHGLGTKEKPESADPIELGRFGTRRLWLAPNDKLPKRSAGQWSVNGTQETIFEFRYDDHETVAANRTKDFVELHSLLEALGYTTPAIADKTKFSPELVKRLRRFQALNGLIINGELDNGTINQLMNIDFAGGGLRRAKPFDTADLPDKIDAYDEPSAPPCPGGNFNLVNPDADRPADENIQEITTRPKYHYYVAGAPTLGLSPAPVPPTGGWISHHANGYLPGFVAMQSRRRTGDAGRFEGGRLSEGESDGGKYFFSARFTEPWKPGRDFQPGPDALFGPHGANPPSPEPAKLCALYQWVPLKHIQRPDGWKMFIKASVRQRSLFENRQRKEGLPDQGRLALELYGDDVFKLDAPDRLGTPRPDPTDPFPKTTDKRRHFTEWYPSHEVVQVADSMDDVARKRFWMLRQTDVDRPKEYLGDKEIEVPTGTVAALVILEGLLQWGWDIDAYFDNVKVAWYFKKAA